MCKPDTVEGVSTKKSQSWRIPLTTTQTWPVCHIDDTVSLYVDILRNILSEKKIGSGRSGYYLASSGSVAWADLYQQMAKALAANGVVEDDMVHDASDKSLEEAAKALGCPREFVPVEMGGAYVASGYLCCSVTRS